MDGLITIESLAEKASCSEETIKKAITKNLIDSLIVQGITYLEENRRLERFISVKGDLSRLRFISVGIGKRIRSVANARIYKNKEGFYSVKFPKEPAIMFRSYQEAEDYLILWRQKNGMRNLVVKDNFNILTHLTYHEVQIILRYVPADFKTLRDRLQRNVQKKIIERTKKDATLSCNIDINKDFSYIRSGCKKPRKE